MALHLALHACSMWPISVDFTVLTAYTAGLSVEETVEHMMRLRDTTESVGEGSVRKDSSCVPCTDRTSSGEPLLAVECERMFENESLGDPQESHMTVGVAGNSSNGDAPPAADVGSDKRGDFEVEKNPSDLTVGFKRRSSRNMYTRATVVLAEEYATLQRTLREVAFGTDETTEAASLRTRFLVQEVTEQFNLFNMLKERYLPTPFAFLSCHAIPMALKERLRVVETFYSVDDAVLKLFFGERMNKLDLDGDSDKGFFFSASRGLRSQKLQQLISDGMYENSLRRQWENLRQVSTFLISAYRGREGMVVPCTVPLLTALQRCFALRGTLGIQYATFVFGFEHRLSGRCWEKLSFPECTSVCHVLASLWCDDSQLMLREDFCTVCTRIARLLDETRVVAEMHLIAFGEAIRPRWQVQLDEVQRAIVPNTMVSASGGTSYGVSAASPVIPSPVANVPPALLPRNTSILPIDTEGSLPSTSNASPRPLAGSRLHSNYVRTNVNNNGSGGGDCFVSGGVGVGVEGGGDGNVNGLAQGGMTETRPSGGSTQYTLACSPTMLQNQNLNLFSSPVTPSAHHPDLSANSAFSRRFMLEFPFLIKCLMRVASMIGNSQQLQEALELLYTRVYITLEHMGQRTTQGVTTSTTEANGNRASGYAASPLSSPCHNEIGEGGAWHLDEADNAHANIATDVEERIGATITVLNTSIMGPAVTASVRPTSTIGVSSPQQNQPQQQQQQQQQQNSLSSTSSVGQNATATGGSIIVNDRPFLRELCMLLSLMPNIFNRLKTLSEEDHSECDSSFSDFILALRFLIQICMAADDHEKT